MKRKNAIQTILSVIGEKDIVVSSTGLISRELYNAKDREANFYVTGSLGLVSSIALGVALNKEEKNIIVIDGDASVLMNLGTLPSIGHYGPANLIHIVLDNHAYGSCSEEPSISGSAKLEKIAKTVGYRTVKSIKTKKELENALKKAITAKAGPVFLLADIVLGGRRDLPRPLDLGLIASRFRNFLSN